MKSVILGHTGSVGRALLAHATVRGDGAVLGLSTGSLDLTDPASVDKLRDVTDDQTILFLASAVTIDATKDSQDVYRVNLRIADNIARFLRDHRVKKCVYFSTVSVYGDETTNMAITEDSPIAPTTHYGTAKYEGECLLQRVSSEEHIPLLVLRLCRIYGPGVRHANYGPVRFLRSIMERGEVDLYGDGSECRCMLYIDDAVRLIYDLAHGDHAGIFNIASDSSPTFLEILDKIRAIVPRSFRVVTHARTRPMINQKFDTRRLREALPRFPYTSLEEGLAATFAALSRAQAGRIVPVV